MNIKKINFWNNPDLSYYTLWDNDITNYSVDEILSKWKNKLSKADFKKLCNSFHLLFSTNSLILENYEPFYIRFKKENKLLDSNLKIVIQDYIENKIPRNEIICDFLDLLYEAYSIMIDYEEVKSNYQLLK